MASMMMTTTYRSYNLGKVFNTGLKWMIRCYQRSNQRHKLSQLDVDRLKDIGISTEQVSRELSKPCWRD